MGRSEKTIDQESRMKPWEGFTLVEQEKTVGWTNVNIPLKRGLRNGNVAFESFRS
jgi:hypothetical protein